VTSFLGGPRRVPTRVLVTDADSRTALACVRSLVAAGHEVWAAGSSRRTLAGVSRGVHPVVVQASPLDEPAAFANEVDRITRRLRIDVLLPVSDASVDALLQFAYLLSPDVTLPLPPFDVFRTGTDKVRMLDLARAAGFDVPASYTMASAADVDAAVAAMTFPAILKPHRSVVTDPDGRCHKLDVEFVPDEVAMRAVVAAMPEGAYPMLAQERIRGSGEGLFALRWDGQPVASFAHRRLREKPPAGGISVFREAVAASDALVESTFALLAALDWQGVAMVECKVNERTGRHVFMELNGRLWGSLQLAIDAGVDFPALLVACAVGEPVERPAPYVVGTRSRWFWGDVDHLYARVAKSPERLHLEAPYPSRAQVVRDFLLAPFRAGRAEVERWNDPAPALLESARRLMPPLPSFLRRPRPVRVAPTTPPPSPLAAPLSPLPAEGAGDSAAVVSRDRLELR
jgi:predicted ATP-grasp superfamily ATP-dependent carboligase